MNDIVMNLQEEAYRLIRRKARDIVNPCTNEQLGEYVRGVVDLQTEIYKFEYRAITNEVGE